MIKRTGAPADHMNASHSASSLMSHNTALFIYLMGVLSILTNTGRFLMSLL